MGSLLEATVLVGLGLLFFEWLSSLQEVLFLLAILSALLHAVKCFLNLFGVVVAGVRSNFGVIDGRGEGALL